MSHITLAERARLELRPHAAMAVVALFSRRFDFPKLVQRDSITTFRYPLSFETAAR